MAENATLTLTAEISETQNIFLELCFDTIIRESIQLNTDITDHLVEGNYNVQDHIAIKPVEYTLTGLVSEKVFTSPRSTAHNISVNINKLIPIKDFFPKFNSYVQSAINAYETIRNYVKKIADVAGNIFDKQTYKRIWDELGTKNNNNELGKWSSKRRQETVLELLNHYRVARIPVNIRTGWGLNFDENSKTNFYITSIQMTQAETYQQSELTITVKELRTTAVQLRAFDKDDYERYNAQMETEKELGKVGTTQVDDPILYKVLVKAPQDYVGE